MKGKDREEKGKEDEGKGDGTKSSAIKSPSAIGGQEQGRLVSSEGGMFISQLLFGLQKRKHLCEMWRQQGGHLGRRLYRPRGLEQPQQL